MWASGSSTRRTRAHRSGSCAADQRSLGPVKPAGIVRPSSLERAAASAAAEVSHHSFAGRRTSSPSPRSTAPCCWPETPTPRTRARGEDEEALWHVVHEKDGDEEDLDAPPPGWLGMTKQERKALQKETGIARNSDGTRYVDPTIYVDRYARERLDEAWVLQAGTRVLTLLRSVFDTKSTGPPPVFVHIACL